MHRSKFRLGPNCGTAVRRGRVCLWLCLGLGLLVQAGMAQQSQEDKYPENPAVQESAP